MKYDVGIDYQIVNLLLRRKEHVSDKQLCEHLCKSGKKISKPTYFSHKKKLMGSGHVRSIDKGIRGAKVEYCATEKAEEEEKLGILRFPLPSSYNQFPEAEKQLRSYFIVLFHACRSHDHFYMESTTTPFTNFVNRFSLSENNHRMSQKASMYQAKTIRYTIPGFTYQSVA